MYNTTKVTDYITLDKILKKVDELAIYNYYSDEVLSIGKPIKSPLRRDNNPSFALYVSKNGKIMWKDFSTGDSGDVIKFVKWKLHTDYKHALKYIWRDLIAEPIGKFNIVEYKRPNYVSRTEIGIKRKYFSKTDDNYWGQYGLDRRILKRYKVTPIHNFWINEVKQSFSYDEKSPMYAYRIFNKFKIYRPMSKTKKDKWRTNCNSYDIQGYEQLPETGRLLIITKSLKDVMVLSKFGYLSVAPQSENSTIPTKIMDNLRSRFRKIVIFFDYDEGGIKGAETLSKKFDLNYKFIPKKYYDIFKAKDISDFRKHLGDDNTRNLLKEMFKNEAYKTK